MSTVVVPTQKIAASQLRGGHTITVQGTVSFSHIASQYNGQALQDRIEQQKKRGALYPTTDPHTVIAIVDAEVLYKDPANPTAEEFFIAQKFYTSKSGDNAGKVAYQNEDKGRNLPLVFAPSPDGKHAQVKLERELANGLKVLLQISTYKSQGFANAGLRLDGIVLLEELRYYQNARINNDSLAAHGIVISGPIQNYGVDEGVQDEAYEHAPEGDGQAAPAVDNTVIENGFAMPAPVTVQAPAAPVAAPAAPAAIPEQPTFAAAPVAPVAPAAPVVAAAPAAQPAPAPAPAGQSAFADAAPAPAAPAVDSVQAQRDALMAQIAALPVDPTTI